MRWAFWLLVVVTALSWAPVLSAFGSLGLGSALGCTVNEAQPNPCLVLGLDLGGALYSGFVLGWLMLVTLPFALAALLAWVVLGLRAIWRRFR